MDLQLFDCSRSLLQLLALLFLDQLDLVELILKTSLVFNQLDDAFALYFKVFLENGVLILIQLSLGRVFAVFFNYSFILPI